MADRLGVTRFPVRVTPVSGSPLMRLRARLDVMEREVEHMRTAVKDVKNALARHDNRLLTSGVMNSRNWTLSAVMSHCYVQNLLGADTTGGIFAAQVTSPTIQGLTLFRLAVLAGVDDGARDRTI